MRHITVKREKTSVACLAQMTVFVEDSTTIDAVLDGLPCRRVGLLANNGELTFEIDDAPRRVYVVYADHKPDGNEYYPVPAGFEDMVISGKNVYNPGNGNPFRFNGITDERLLAARKKKSKRGVLVFIAAIVIGLLVGVGVGVLRGLAGRETPAEPKTFTKGDFSITLTDAFEEITDPDYVVVYVSDDASAAVFRERLSADKLAEITPADYAAVLAKMSEIDAEVQSANGLTFFEYEYPAEDGTPCSYLMVVYKTGDSFWAIQFGSFKTDYTEFRPQFIEWAQSAAFEKQPTETQAPAA